MRKRGARPSLKASPGSPTFSTGRARRPHVARSGLRHDASPHPARAPVRATLRRRVRGARLGPQNGEPRPRHRRESSRSGGRRQQAGRDLRPRRRVARCQPAGARPRHLPLVHHEPLSESGPWPLTVSPGPGEPERFTLIGRDPVQRARQHVERAAPARACSEVDLRRIERALGQLRIDVMVSDGAVKPPCGAAADQPATFRPGSARLSRRGEWPATSRAG